MLATSIHLETGAHTLLILLDVETAQQHDCLFSEYSTVNWEERIDGFASAEISYDSYTIWKH